MSDQISATERGSALDTETVEPVRVFISHRTAPSAEAALEIKREMEHAVVGYLKVFVASEIRNIGQDWRREITAALDRAEYLLLLFTDPNEDWGWCLWETGYFEGHKRGKIIAIYNGDNPQGPLSIWQGLEFRRSSELSEVIKDILKSAKDREIRKASLEYCPDDLAKIDSMLTSASERITERIQACFGNQTRRPQALVPSLTISIPDELTALQEDPSQDLLGTLRLGRVVDSAVVRACPRAQQVFGFNPAGETKSYPWLDFRAKLRGFERAVYRLEGVIAEALLRAMIDEPIPPCPVFRTNADPQRLVLSRKWYSPASGNVFEFLLHPIPLDEFVRTKYGEPGHYLAIRNTIDELTKRLIEFQASIESIESELTVDYEGSDNDDILNRFNKRIQSTRQSVDRILLEATARFETPPQDDVANEKPDFWKSFRPFLAALACIETDKSGLSQNIQGLRTTLSDLVSTLFVFREKLDTALENGLFSNLSQSQPTGLQ